MCFLQKTHGFTSKLRLDFSKKNQK